MQGLPGSSLFLSDHQDCIVGTLLPRSHLSTTIELHFHHLHIINLSLWVHAFREIPTFKPNHSTRARRQGCLCLSRCFLCGPDQRQGAGRESCSDDWQAEGATCEQCAGTGEIVARERGLEKNWCSAYNILFHMQVLKIEIDTEIKQVW